MNECRRENEEREGMEEVIRAREERRRAEREGERGAPHEPMPHFTVAFFAFFPSVFVSARPRIQGRISEINKRKPFNLTPARRR